MLVPSGCRQLGHNVMWLPLLPNRRLTAPKPQWYAVRERQATMIRATNVFAAASVGLLVLGLVLSNFIGKTQVMSVRWPSSNTGYVIGFQVPCYGLAGEFAIFACAYALGWIRLSASMVDWHVWLSLSGAAMFGLCFGLLAHIGAEYAAPQPGQGTLIVIAVGMIIGPVSFVAGQLLLIIALVVHFAAPHH